MQTSLFLAQVFGLAYTIIGLGIIFNNKHYTKMIEELRTSAHYSYLGGVAAFVVGFAIITYHNIWISGWEVIITILGWAALIKGILLLALPQYIIDLSIKITKTKNLLTAFGGLALIIGLVLVYFGFFA
ncbi:hypothetical protein KJ951_04500 [Patescibacteria group bacterium]|nr:hypothetical protein [Patescibacteria group bacterium]MBU1703639.1 hypothetical protein [Patescibacteria group bacterium]MBU1954212.1 hypothetical protein [Patescibacteria group bacterium]